ncbi:MAG: isoaspartyl peptidase/L-asparaginase family protein [Trueperaceae bacterium]
MPKLIVHGGAGTIAEARRSAYHRGLRAALAAGWAVLDAGGDAVEATLRAVETMEADAEAFNAGVGGSPNRDGEVELDAAVVRGADGSAGAVAAVRTAPSAVRLADLVRRTTPHVLLVGTGADALVERPIDPERLLTPHSRAAWERWRSRQAEADAAPPPPTGSATVGAVAHDAAGDLAAATSTGGVLGKWPGRVGDAPIVGAGTYADRSVAISCTGRGEAFLRAVTAKALAERLAAGVALADALARALADVRDHQGSGGLIVVTADGRLAYAFDTAHLALGWTDGMTTVAEVLGSATVTVVPGP